MNLAASKAVLHEALIQLANGRLAVGKDNRCLDQIIAQQPAQSLALLALRHLDLERGDVFVGAGRALGLDPLGIGQESLRQLLNRRRHCGREQQSLARFG